jgi:hypothetical protein
MCDPFLSLSLIRSAMLGSYDSSFTPVGFTFISVN